MKDVENAFSDAMEPEEFKKKYGREKPPKDRCIIFSCLEGFQAQIAVDTIEKMGYTK